MALTTNQLNAHIRTTIQDQLPFEDGNNLVLMFFLRASIRHCRLGGADNIEAGKAIAQFVFEKINNRTATAADLEKLQNHLAIEADSTAAGVLG